MTLYKWYKKKEREKEREPFVKVRRSLDSKYNIKLHFIRIHTQVYTQNHVNLLSKYKT